MTCSDDARLLYAYGEPCGREERRHIEVCPACLEEVRGIRDVSRLYSTVRRPSSIRRLRLLSWAALALGALGILLASPSSIANDPLCVRGEAIDQNLARVEARLDVLRPADEPVDAQLDDLRARIAELAASEEDF